MSIGTRSLHIFIQIAFNIFKLGAGEVDCLAHKHVDFRLDLCHSSKKSGVVCDHSTERAETGRSPELRGQPGPSARTRFSLRKQGREQLKKTPDFYS